MNRQSIFLSQNHRVPEHGWQPSILNFPIVRFLGTLLSSYGFIGEKSLLSPLFWNLLGNARNKNSESILMILLIIIKSKRRPKWEVRSRLIKEILFIGPSTDRVIKGSKFLPRNPSQKGPIHSTKQPAAAPPIKGGPSRSSNAINPRMQNLLESTRKKRRDRESSARLNNLWLFPFGKKEEKPNRILLHFSVYLNNFESVQNGKKRVYFKHSSLHREWMNEWAQTRIGEHKNPHKLNERRV